jgi:hypothetical protein
MKCVLRGQPLSPDKSAHGKEVSARYCEAKGIREASNERGILKELADLSASKELSADPQPWLRADPNRKHTAACSVETGNPWSSPSAASKLL